MLNRPDFVVLEQKLGLHTIFGRTPGAARKSIEENPMMHKFQVGQSVALIPRVIRQAAAGTYEITRLMPENEVEPHYRIKSDAERHERVVPESELETSLTS
jgi:hypothetical protein